MTTAAPDHKRREVVVNRKQLQRCLIAVAAVLALSACRDRVRKAGPTVTTQTVAPAAAQPSPTGTDAVTQTVNVDDGRSEDEGADATETASAPAPSKNAPAKHAKTPKKHH